MESPELAQTSFSENTLRRKVEFLRHQAYEQPDPGASPQLLDRLMQAEEELRRADLIRRGEAGSPTRGVLLDATSAGQSPSGMLLGTGTTGVDARVLLHQAHIPTGIVHLFDSRSHPLVSYHLRYTGDEYIRLRLTTYVEGYSAQCVDTIELQSGQEPVEILHLPTFFPERIQAVNELTRATLHIQIDNLDGAIEQHNTFPIWLLARTSACLSMVDAASGQFVDLSPYLAAWVTPNAPAVMQLLSQAAGLHPDRAISGYQVDKAGVETQVQCIYQALKAQGIHYVNSLICFGAGRTEQAQRIRLPSESLETHSANCIDGTVLMASLLEAASLNPGIVLVPGHAFLAWETQDGNEEWDYLETTMLGTHEFADARRSAQALIARQKLLAERMQDSHYFRLHSIAVLRSRPGISPMA